MELTRKFDQLGKGDAAIAGGKGASLGEMTQARIPVPPGFVILANAFERFLEAADLSQELDAILDQEVNRHEIRTVELASEKIKALILDAKMPEAIADEIQEQFRKLGAQYVAVRPSATAEDSSSAAWAGQLESYLNTTEENLLENVQKCWASLFTPRAIFYRFEKGMHGEKISVAVIVQKMVQSEVSGIAFSVHPVTEDYNQLIIEAGFGLGEAIVSGQITPDSFVVEKTPRRIIDKNISYQSKALWRGKKGNVWRELSEEEGSKPALTDEQALNLAKLILKIEDHYGFPCDIEWAYEAGRFYITQSRPITTLAPKKVRNFSSAENQNLVVEKIKRIDWQQDWDAIYTPLEASFDNQPDNETYFSSFRKVFGRSISRMLVVFRGEMGTAWLSTSEYEAVGTYLAKKALDQKFLGRWLSEFKRLADEAMPLVQKTPEEFLENLEAFRIKYPAFGPYVIGTKMAYDFIPSGKQKILKELEAARKYSEKFYFCSGSMINQVVQHIASRSGYPKEFARRMTADELQQYATSGFLPSRSELESRAKIAALFIEQGAQYPLTEEDFSPIEQYWRRSLNGRELHGMGAYPGKVKARARIILDYRDAIIQNGEILVTGMTDPNFMPLMEKCSAIVADNGGMLSHAAIVARELQKPCVVGTKFATKILKDGDMIEVDADKGIVRQL